MCRARVPAPVFARLVALMAFLMLIIGGSVNATGSSLACEWSVRCKDQLFPAMQGVTFSVLPKPYSKIFDAPGTDAVVEHFQASRGQFKVRKALRRARQIATIVGGIAAALLLWWLSHKISISWK